MKDNYKNAFAIIADLWPNFKQPETMIGIGIWDKALSRHDERTIMAAIETLYHREHFFSFGKLMEILGDMTKPQMLTMGEVVERVQKLSRNINSNLDKEDELVRETIKQAGGIRTLAHSEDSEEWKLKKIQSAYREAVEIVEKRQLQQLKEPEVLKLNE